MSAFSSFITQKPTEENIQAIMDTELLILKRSDMDMLYEKSSAWQKVGKEQRIVSFQKHTAKQRYETLIEQHSNYLKYIPLQFLATYLGITPRHLSRLRKEISL